MSWRWVKAFPKFALVFLLLIGSTLAFGFWWYVLRTPKFTIRTQPVEDRSQKSGSVEAKMGRLIVVDNELYDVDSGDVIFRNWLKKGMPVKLFWEAESKTLLAQYPLAFVRYGLDGSEKASLFLKHPFAIADDYKWIVFAKDKDVWLADIDWKNLTLKDERKVTSIGQFNDQYFAENIVLGSEKTLVVRNLNQLLRVSLDSGEVHPSKIPMPEIGKRRSPDGRYLVGIQNGQFYCYDVDSDEAKAIQVGRGAINDYQWLGNDRCVAIAAMKAVSRGLLRGGWCPEGRRAEDGAIPARYCLQETGSTNYLARTERNVVDSDGTVIFTLKSELSGGSKRTGDFARKHGKPLLHLYPGIENPGEALAAFITANGIGVLNAAGPRLSGAAGIGEFVRATLEAAILRK